VIGKLILPDPLFLYEPSRHNVRPVLGWGVVRRGGGDGSELPGLAWCIVGPSAMAEGGVSSPTVMANGGREWAMGSVWNIVANELVTDGSVTLDEIEVIMVDETHGRRWGSAATKC